MGNKGFGCVESLSSPSDRSDQTAEHDGLTNLGAMESMRSLPCTNEIPGKPGRRKITFRFRLVSWVERAAHHRAKKGDSHYQDEGRNDAGVRSRDRRQRRCFRSV